MVLGKGLSPNPPSLFFEQSAGTESLQVRLRSLGHPGGALVGEAPEHLLEAEVNPRG